MEEEPFCSSSIFPSVCFHYRYVTEIPGGESYVSFSVVLPALFHLHHVMEISDDDESLGLKQHSKQT